MILASTYTPLAGIIVAKSIGIPYSGQHTHWGIVVTNTDILRVFS